MFVLGCVVILDAIVSAGNPWPEIGIGAVMVGILPLDRAVLAMRDGTGRGRVRRRIHPRDNPDDE